MNPQEVSELFETLKSWNNETESSSHILGHIFDTCLKLSDVLEDSTLSTNEMSFQDCVKICIKSLEKCTRMVNDLDLFSSNETIEEVQTSSLKYLLLPVLLGNLNLALQSKELTERYKFLEIAEVYFKDFLLRCRNYELSKRVLINKYENEVLEDINSEEYIKKQTIADLAAVRESKIEQYKLRKQLKERETELKPALNREDAEESVREYYLLILERWMLTAIEELANIKSEKCVISHMLKKNEDKSKQISPKGTDIKPLKPIIITRNEVQKKVFGLGYPSIPVMTIDDFYRQRFEKMVDEHKSSGKSLQDMAMAGGGNREDEEIQKEILLEIDDPEALRKARGWDDWKDDNQRGSGNRKNKG